MEDGGNSLLRAATANQLLEHTFKSYLLRNIRPRACVSVCVCVVVVGGGYAPLKARATNHRCHPYIRDAFPRSSRRRFNPVES